MEKILPLLLLVAVLILAVAHVVSEIRGMAMDRAKTAQQERERAQAAEELY